MDNSLTDKDGAFDTLMQVLDSGKITVIDDMTSRKSNTERLKNGQRVANRDDDNEELFPDFKKQQSQQHGLLRDTKE